MVLAPFGCVGVIFSLHREKRSPGGFLLIMSGFALAPFSWCAGVFWPVPLLPVRYSALSGSDTQEYLVLSRVTSLSVLFAIQSSVTHWAYESSLEIQHCASSLVLALSHRRACSVHLCYGATVALIWICVWLQYGMWAERVFIYGARPSVPLEKSYSIPAQGDHPLTSGSCSFSCLLSIF